MFYCMFYFTCDRSLSQLLTWRMIRRRRRSRAACRRRRRRADGRWTTVGRRRSSAQRPVRSDQRPRQIPAPCTERQLAGTTTEPATTASGPVTSLTTQTSYHYTQYTPPTRLNCRAASRRRRRCVHEFATSSRRLPTDSVDNLETDCSDSIAVWLRAFWSTLITFTAMTSLCRHLSVTSIAQQHRNL